MSIIKAIPVNELDRLTSVSPTADSRGVECETYVIPDYQRGYRWDADIHVQALLNDILSFSKMQRKSTDSYCLQPIVVAPSASNPGAWEVIDGQQRLTTLYLLLHALDPSGSFYKSFDIIFETRTKSNDFLSDLVSKGIMNHDEPDFHYMSAAWAKIISWISEQKKKDNGFVLSYITTLRNQVNIIWYNTESTDRKDNIDVFNRLNVGKIPLTNAELVKALLLTKLKGLYQGEELSLRQAELNNEWHRMETELRKPAKWGFLESSLSEGLENHIELIFRLLAEKENKGQYGTYLYFEKKVTDNDATPLAQAQNAIRLWLEIKQAFARVDSWFCDATPETSATIYHYVGFLLASHRKSVADIFKLAEGKGREAFRKALKSEIIDIIKDTDLAGINYQTDKESVKRILLLFNVLSCDSVTKGPFNRFPFDRYNEVDRKEKWSLEHINAQNSQEPLKSTSAMRKWVEETWNSVRNIDSIRKVFIDSGGNEEIRTINILPEKTDLKRLYDLPEDELKIDEVSEVRSRFDNLFNEGEYKHALGNMALLSRPDNSALNNSIFPVKRDHIVMLEKNGSFIPPCTRNVFLKFYSDADTQPYYWGRKDQKAYFNEIKRVIDNFRNK